MAKQQALEAHVLAHGIVLQAVMALLPPEHRQRIMARALQIAAGLQEHGGTSQQVAGARVEERIRGMFSIFADE